MIKFTKINDTYYRVTVADVKLGEIVVIGKGFWGNKPPFKYTFTTTFTVAGEGRRPFGGEFNSLEDAKECATRMICQLRDLLIDASTNKKEEK